MRSNPRDASAFRNVVAHFTFDNVLLGTVTDAASAQSYNVYASHTYTAQDPTQGQQWTYYVTERVKTSHL